MGEASLLINPAESAAPPAQDVHFETLGYLAVTGPQSRADLQVELGSVRDQLSGMNHDQADLFDQFCRTAVPLDLQAEKDAEAPEAAWNVWLFRGTSDQELLNFLKWNVQSVREQQNDDQFQETLEGERQVFKRGVAKGLQDGWLHPDFEVAIEGVDGLSVYVGDGFTTHARSRDGYCIRGTEQVVIAGARRIRATGFTGLYATTRRAAGHEFTHPFGRLKARWLDEAATEHLNQVYKYGQPEIINPSDRRDNFSQGYYPAERDVAAIFPSRLFTLAYSQTEGRSCLDDLIHDFNQGWAAFAPEDQTAFGQLCLRIRSLELQHQRSGLSKGEAGNKASEEVRQLLAWNPKAVFVTPESE